MAELARAGSRNQHIRNLAVMITTAGFLNGQGLRQKDWEGEARRLHEFVRDQIRYVRDTAGAELLHTPETLLRTGAGDCDDKAILLAALLASIGHNVSFRAVAFQPGVFSHVWVRDDINGRWVDLETTEPFPFGQSVPLRGAAEILDQPL